VTALDGAAQAASQPERLKPCFFTHEIRNHKVADRNTIYIDVTPHNVYRVTMANSCMATATNSDPLIIRNRPSGTPVCRPLDLDIGVRGSRCIVSGITLLSPAEAAALPRKMRP